MQQAKMGGTKPDAFYSWNLNNENEFLEGK